MVNANNDRKNIEHDEISLKHIILKIDDFRKYLLSKKTIIGIAIIVGAAIGLTTSLLIKPVYKAELSFSLEDSKSSEGGLGAAAGLASQFGFNLGGIGGAGDVFSGDNLLELMKSRYIVESTLLSTVMINGKPQTLAERYIDFNRLHEDWDSKPKLKNIRFINNDRSHFTLQQDSILGVFFKSILKKNLSVDKIDPKLSIIDVVVSSTDEIFSKEFAEVLVKNVSDFYVKTKTKKSAQNVAILQRQTDSVRRELNSAITGVASNTDYNPNPNPSLQILRVPSQKRQVDVQANTAILTQLVANLELSKISLRKETPLIQLIDRPIYPLEKTKFGKLKGIALGAIGACFIMTFFFLVKYIWKSIMA